jgi:hypothetical protein
MANLDQDARPGDLFPALRSRDRRTTDPRRDAVRRELARAYERGALTAEELASTLERLDRARSDREDRVD